MIRRTLDALFAGFEPGELDVVVVCNGCTDDTATLARASGHPVRVLELPACVEARRPPERRRGGEGFPAPVPGRRRVAARVGGPLVLERLRSGALAARPPIRYEIERRVCAGAQLLPSSIAGSCRPGLALGCWRLRALGDRTEPVRRFPGRGGGRPLGGPAVRARTRWRSSTARRSWCRCRVAVAISYGFSVVPIAAKGSRHAHPICATGRRRPSTSTLRDLARAGLTGPAAALDAATYAAFAAGARLALALPHRVGALACR